MKKPLGTIGRTGQKCPESGIWKVTATSLLGGSRTIPLSKGNTFPPDQNKSVTWELIQYA